jgi:phosphoribosylaminoimidazolecarboxamide formyltransferase/IMP cyclohydrolase
MADDLKKMYKTVMDDHFPSEMTITFGDQVLVYKKRTWKIAEEKTGELIEKGLRYGENPGQEAALYELVNGNLVLGDCRFIEPGNGLVSAIGDDDMIQSGKHPGKINLTDIDNALNIIKYLSDTPAVVIVKHNNPCGVAKGSTLSDARDQPCRMPTGGPIGRTGLLPSVVVRSLTDRWTYQRLNWSQKITWKWLRPQILKREPFPFWRSGPTFALFV